MATNGASGAIQAKIDAEIEAEIEAGLGSDSGPPGGGAQPAERQAEGIRPVLAPFDVARRNPAARSAVGSTSRGRSVARGFKRKRPIRQLGGRRAADEDRDA